MRLRIRQLFGIAELQGAPSLGRRRFGVPPGGAFDQIALEYVNALCGNDPGAPALEIATTAFGDAPLLDAECEEAGTLALAGAQCLVQVDGRETLGQGRVLLEAGAQVQIRLRQRGMRAYLSSPGSLIYKEKLLEAEGESLPSVRMDQLPESLAEGPFRFIPMGEEQAVTHLTVEPSSNRVGLRLSGYQGKPRKQEESEASVIGAIQITPGGELLVHGPDGPTTGGYPKIGVVIGADISRLAQLRPGQNVSLQPVERDEAVRLAQELRQSVLTRTDSLRRLLAP